jgi:predicted nucleic acid-binding protein
MLFVALAQRFGCTLLTVDSKLIAIARKIDATLLRNLIESYFQLACIS